MKQLAIMMALCFPACCQAGGHAHAEGHAHHGLEAGRGRLVRKHFKIERHVERERAAWLSKWKHRHPAPAPCCHPQPAPCCPPVHYHKHVQCVECLVPCTNPCCGPAPQVIAKPPCGDAVTEPEPEPTPEPIEPTPADPVPEVGDLDFDDEATILVAKGYRKVCTPQGCRLVPIGQPTPAVRPVPTATPVPATTRPTSGRLTAQQFAQLRANQMAARGMVNGHLPKCSRSGFCSQCRAKGKYYGFEGTGPNGSSCYPKNPWQYRERGEASARLRDGRVVTVRIWR